jgi:hypothetical protein
MKVKFNQITWYSKLLSIFFIFGIFPIIIFYIALEYQKTVNVITYGQTAAEELHSSNNYEKKAYRGTNAKQAELYLIGSWSNDQDTSYVFKVKDENTFIDIVGESVTASGSWVLRDHLNETKYSETEYERTLYLEKNSLNRSDVKEVTYYKVVLLNQNNLVLQSLTDGKVQTFIKKGSATINKNPGSVGTTTKGE